MSENTTQQGNNVRICVVGAGATGLTAAYKLAGKGYDVTVLEREPFYGGLAGAIPAGKTRLESFYHHIFTSDTHLTDLAEELGISGLLKWAAPKNGIYVDGLLQSFTSPADLLRFRAMPLAARVRTGLLVLKARSIKDWQDMEGVNAKEWLIKNAGAASYEKLWGPLLKSKFGSDAESVSAVWIWNKFKLRGSSRGKNISSEMLGYMEGSFSVIYDKLVEKINSFGGKVLCGEGIESITPCEGGGYEVVTVNRREKYDIVLSTTSPGIMAKIVQGLPDSYRDSLSAIRYKADICVLLEMEKSLSPYYWVTVAEKDYPFVLVIEHTKLFPDSKYGSNLVYLSRYLDEKDEMYKLSDEEIIDLFAESLKKMFPSWNKSSVKAARVFRARFAQPVVTMGYSKIRPKFEAPLENLYLASMAQIYPEDRGQNYAIRSGIEAADLLVEKLSGPQK